MIARSARRPRRPRATPRPAATWRPSRRRGGSASVRGATVRAHAARPEQPMSRPRTNSSFANTESPAAKPSVARGDAAPPHVVGMTRWGQGTAPARPARPTASGAPRRRACVEACSSASATSSSGSGCGEREVPGAAARRQSIAWAKRACAALRWRSDADVANAEASSGCENRTESPVMSTMPARSPRSSARSQPGPKARRECLAGRLRQQRREEQSLLDIGRQAPQPFEQQHVEIVRHGKRLARAGQRARLDQCPAELRARTTGCLGDVSWTRSSTVRGNVMASRSTSNRSTAPDAEWTDRDSLDGVLVEDDGDRRATGGLECRAHRSQQPDRRVVHSAQRERECTRRRLIEPLHIVHGDDDGPFAGERAQRRQRAGADRVVIAAARRPPTAARPRAPAVAGRVARRARRRSRRRAGHQGRRTTASPRPRLAGTRALCTFVASPGEARLPQRRLAERLPRRR